MKDRRPRKLPAPRVWFRKPLFKILLSAFLFIFIIVSGVTLYYYQHYSRLIERRLSGEIFQNTARLYATPYHIYPGQKLTPDAVIARLQRAGLEPEGAQHGKDGTYGAAKNKVTVKPAVGEAIQLDFQQGYLTRISRQKTGEAGEAYLPAELVTSFSDDNRQKRRIVEFRELPPTLVHALIAAEDNRFYSHYGIDPIRLTGAVFQSVRNADRLKGTSTITQQLSRNFFLTTSEPTTWQKVRRKGNEIFISLLLEQRLSKQQILTLYANDVYLGARGSFQIKGFGEGAAAYFGKDLTALTLPEAATLAAIIPAPSGIYSPSRHPDRARERRNIVLNAMAELGFIKPEEAEGARKTDLKLAPLKMDATDAPYLVDYIRDSLLRDFSEDALSNDHLRVETTLDPDLQRAAVDAVYKGLKEVNAVIAQRNKSRKAGNKLPEAQAALIALDTRTAAIRAMVGGGDYGASQYNRITQAFRQPGSIFKPFVFAAAFEECHRLITPPEVEPVEVVEGAEPVEPPTPPTPPGSAEDCITPVTVFDDVQTTFTYDGDRIYEPNNYHEQYNGQVTARYALEHSLNVPTIKVAEAVDYERVAALARSAGMNAKIKGYPSVALGAFEVTPIEMAGAYTIFPNGGKRRDPHALLRVVAEDGAVRKLYKYPEKQVLSPSVAYLMTHIMEGVINSGTGAGVRSRGFTLPAAGKTGTSRDGWFAGFTRDFIVIAWVGFDDNTDLNLEGAKSALPIWTDFMLKAQELYPPRDLDAMYFGAPDGIEFATVDGHESIKGCTTYEESFLTGTVPTSGCVHHRGAVSSFLGGVGRALGRLFGGGEPTPPTDTHEEPSTSSR